MCLKGLQKYQQNTDQNQRETGETKPATGTEQPSTLSNSPVKTKSATNSSPQPTRPYVTCHPHPPCLQSLRPMSPPYEATRIHADQLTPCPQSSARQSPHATPSSATAAAQPPIGVTFSCTFRTSKPSRQCLKNSLIPGNWSPVSLSSSSLLLQPQSETPGGCCSATRAPALPVLPGASGWQPLLSGEDSCSPSSPSVWPETAPTPCGGLACPSKDITHTPT